MWRSLQAQNPHASQPTEQPTEQQRRRAACSHNLLQQLQDVGLPMHVSLLMPAVAKQLHAEQAADLAPSNKSDRVRGLLRLPVELLDVQQLFDDLRSYSGVPSATAPAGTALLVAVLRCTEWLAQQQQHQQQHSRKDSRWPFLDAALQHLQQVETFTVFRELGPDRRDACPVECNQHMQRAGCPQPVLRAPADPAAVSS